MTNRFPKSHRLQTRAQFLHLQKHKSFFEGKFLYFEYMQADELKLGLTITKAYGKAVKRIQLKRRIREVFRRLKNIPNLWINVKPRLSEKPSYFEIKKDFEEFLDVYNHRSSPQRKSQKMHSHST